MKNLFKKYFSFSSLLTLPLFFIFFSDLIFTESEFNEAISLFYLFTVILTLFLCTSTQKLIAELNDSFNKKSFKNSKKFCFLFLVIIIIDMIYCLLITLTVFYLGFKFNVNIYNIRTNLFYLIIYSISFLLLYNILIYYKVNTKNLILLLIKLAHNIFIIYVLYEEFFFKIYSEKFLEINSYFFTLIALLILLAISTLTLHLFLNFAKTKKLLSTIMLVLYIFFMLFSYNTYKKCDELFSSRNINYTTTSLNNY